MTLPLNSRLSALYDTNGTQKDFSFGFRVFFDPDNGGYGLEVRRQTADGYEVIPKSDYLVLPVEDNSAGIVRFSIAPSAGQKIYIAGKTPTIQQLVLTNFGRYSAESIETQFDFITAIIQEWLSSLDEEERQRKLGDQITRDYIDQQFIEWKSWVEVNVPLITREYLDFKFNDLKKEWQDAMNEIISGNIPALAIPTSSGKNQQQINDSVGADWYEKASGYDLHDRVRLVNGIVVKNIIGGNTNNPNINLLGWVVENATDQIFIKSPIASRFDRLVSNRFMEEVNIRDFGAIGDGTLHTLQEWVDSGYFSNLTAIQMVFPLASSLSDSIDWIVTQHLALNSPNLFCPAGTYITSACVRGPHSHTPYNVGSVGMGVRIFGDGVKTCFKRNDIRPATRELIAGGASTTRASDEANQYEACFSIHAPYSSITDMTIADSAVGVYLGQDYTKALTPTSNISAVHKSNFERLSIDRCGTGVLMLATGGNHYCNFSDIHFSRCQIDIDLRASHWWKIDQGRGDSNNNRNVFTRIRSARSRVGFWNSCGDSNNLIAWHAESMPSTANPFPLPTWLPVDLTVSTAIIFSGSNQLNTVSHCFAEDVALYVYNDGYENRFFGNGFTEDKVIMKQPPKEWRGRYVFRDRGIGYADNSFTAFPDMPVAGALYLGLGVTPNGVRTVAKDAWHQPSTNARASFEREFQIETGAIAASTPVAFTIWGNSDASASGMVELDIVGRCDVAGQTSTYIVKALANVYKASTRVPSRYSIHKIFASRATGQGTSDTADASQMTASLQINPTVGQELQVVLSCPQELTSATIFVKQKVAK